MRGEYLTVMSIDCLLAELPPRARRIQHGGVDSVAWTGTTSACAENTHGHSMTETPAWNYLRVRGEYRIEWKTTIENVELPPRARRIHMDKNHPGEKFGTTSACAENT